jgi:multidrug efflux pump subunit AcrA (membrane-fusion protein)
MPAADPASRTNVVRINLPGLPRLRSGLFGRAAFPLGARKVLPVPAGAVIEQGQLRSVLVAENGYARARLITLGESRQDRREVLSGLSEGERFIFPIPAGLTDGARVEVRP